MVWSYYCRILFVSFVYQLEKQVSTLSIYWKIAYFVYYQEFIFSIDIYIKYVNEAVEYVLKQSLKLRKAEVDNSNILSDDELGFYAAVDRVNDIQENQRIEFTYTKPVEVLPKLDIKAFIKELRAKTALQCNTLINIYTRYYIDRVYNLYVYQLVYKISFNLNIYTFIHIIYSYVIQRIVIST